MNAKLLGDLRKVVTERELNRAVQYVTASTSYGRETVAEIIRTGFAEFVDVLATSGPRTFERQTLGEYVCSWTVQRTGHPEPMVREVLGCAERWLDGIYKTFVGDQPHEPGDTSKKSQ
jgi:hypothetical protein